MELMLNNTLYGNDMAAQESLTPTEELTTTFGKGELVVP